MKISEIFLFSQRFIRTHWKRNLLVFSGIFLASFFLMTFLSFAQGMKHSFLRPIEQRLATDVLVITKKPPEGGSVFNPLRFLQASARRGISAEEKREIESFPEVKNLSEEVRLAFPVATRTQIILGLMFEFDITVSGYEESAMTPFLEAGQTFSGEEEFLPIVLSPLLVQIYNSVVGDMVPNAEQKTLEDFIGREVYFDFGNINYLDLLYQFPSEIPPEKKIGKIVGFAPFVSPLTFAIPIDTAREMREKYENISPENILPRSLLVTLFHPSQVLSFQQKLDQSGFQAKDTDQYLDIVRNLVMGLGFVLILSASAILAIAFLLLVTTLMMSVGEHRQTIGVLRALGASKRSIAMIFVVQGGMITFVASILGIICAIVLLFLADQWILSFLPPLMVSFDGIFLQDITLTISVFVTIEAFSLLASWIPARKGANANPLEAILQ